MIVLNAATLGVVTWSPTPLDVIAHDGEVYLLEADTLSKLDAAAVAPTGSVTTGKLYFGRGAKIRRVTVGGSGATTVLHYVNGVAFPATTRDTTEPEAHHATNASYEGRDHQFAITFENEIQYLDVVVVTTRRAGGQNDG